MKHLALLLALAAGVASAQTAPAPADTLVSIEQGELLQQIVLVFTNTWAFLQSIFSTRLIGVQLAGIALALVISWLAAAPIKRRLYARVDKLDPAHTSSKTVLILYRWIARIMSSVVALTVLGVMELALF